MLIQQGTSAGSLFTSCIDPVEPQGLADLREAKADYLAALSGLRAADAKVQEAQAAFVNAQAATQQAIAAQEQAKAEIERLKAELKKAENEKDKAWYESEIARLKEEQAITSAENAMKLAEAQDTLARALKQIEANAMLLTDGERAVVNKATKNYEDCLDAYVTAYHNYSNVAAEYYSKAYDEDKDWKAVYTADLATAKERFDFWSEVLAQFESMDNEPAQWKAALEQYNNEILALKYAKLKLDEEAALQYTDARTAFEELRVYAAAVVDSVNRLNPNSKMLAKVDFPVNNFKKNGIAKQFEYLTKPVASGNSSIFYVNNNGKMGFNQAELSKVKTILYGGALDASDWSDELERSGNSLDGVSAIGLIDIVETLKRDSVVNASNFEEQYKAAEKKYNDALKQFEEDYNLLTSIKNVENDFPPLAKALKNAKDNKPDTDISADSAKLAKAREEVYKVAGQQIAKVYAASDELIAVINKLQDKFAPVNGNKVAFFASGNALIPQYGLWGAWDDADYFDGRDALNYSMTKQDSTELLGAITGLAEVKEQVLRDTARISYYNYRDGSYGFVRVSQLDIEGFKQIRCTNSVHNLNNIGVSGNAGIYCYSLYGGNGFDSPEDYWSSWGTHNNMSVPYRNEYPCYAVNTGTNTNPSWSFLPVYAKDDAFAKAINALSGFALPLIVDAVTTAFENWENGNFSDVSVSWSKKIFSPTSEGWNQFDWNVNVGYNLLADDDDMFVFNFLPIVSSALSGFNSSYRLVDKYGEFMIDRLVDNWYESDWDIPVSGDAFLKAIFEYFGKDADASGDVAITKDDVSVLLTDIIVSLLDINYLQTFVSDDLKDFVGTTIQGIIDIANPYIENLSQIVTDWENGGFDTWVSGDATYIKNDGEPIPVESFISFVSFCKTLITDYDSKINSLAQQVTLDNKEVKDAVKKFFEARDAFDAKFAQITEDVRAYHDGEITAVENAVDSINNVYKRFWGINDVTVVPVKVNYVDSIKATNSSYNRLAWENMEPMSLDELDEEGEEKDVVTVMDGWRQINWSISTFSDPDDIIIPVLGEQDTVMNCNQKLAIVLAQLTDSNMQKDKDYYQNPEASFIIHGQASGDAYTELVKVFFAKYHYEYLANYQENKDALDMIAEGVAALEAAYIAACEASKENDGIYKAKLAEVTGVDFTGKYVEAAWNEIQYIADKKNLDGNVTYDYGKFLERNGASKLGTGTFAAAADEIIGSYLAYKAERDDLASEYDGQIADLEGLINGLTKTYNDILALAGLKDASSNANVVNSDVSGDAENPASTAKVTYAVNYEAVVKYINAQIEKHQRDVNDAQKALDQLAAGYDPHMINAEIYNSKLAKAQELVEIAKAALEKAKAEYDAVIAKYLN